MKDIPLPIQFIVTMVIIIGAIEFGYYLGIALHKRQKTEKEGTISVISGSVLGLLSFILAFTFGSVSDRFDTRKGLVREEANQIETVWLRSDFLPEPDRSASRKLLKEYLGLRISLIKSADPIHIEKFLIRGDKIHQELWQLAIRHGETELHSDLGALYFEGLNKLIEIQKLRIAIAYRADIPTGLWISLYVLLVIAMLSIGYYASVIQSKRSLASVILAFSFSLVIWMISNFNQLQTSYFPISQQPLIDMQAKIAANTPPQ